MPLHLTLRDRLNTAERPLIGVWSVAGSSTVTEILAGSGLDWMLIDMEHSANSLSSILHQLQVVAAYPITPLVRVPVGDDVTLKQVLDLGAQNVLVPMVETAAQAQEIVASVRYAPRGRRGVGSALSRSARWNRVDGYLTDADDYVSLFVQVESAAGAENAAEIAAVDGIDGVFVGPSDLAASLGVIGQQAHASVTDAVLRTFAAVTAAGKHVGVNAFDPAMAESYIAAGAGFVAVAADVSLLARGSEALAARFIPAADEDERASY